MKSLINKLVDFLYSVNSELLICFCISPFSTFSILTELSFNLFSIKVLYDEDEVFTEDENIQFYHFYPIGISTLNNLKHRLRNELNLWQDQVGCPTIADALIKCHVDPALRVQLECQLNQSE